MGCDACDGPWVGRGLSVLARSPHGSPRRVIVDAAGGSKSGPRYAEIIVVSSERQSCIEWISKSSLDCEARVASRAARFVLYT